MLVNSTKIQYLGVKVMKNTKYFIFLFFSFHVVSGESGVHQDLLQKIEKCMDLNEGKDRADCFDRVGVSISNAREVSDSQSILLDMALEVFTFSERALHTLFFAFAATYFPRNLGVNSDEINILMGSLGALSFLNILKNYTYYETERNDLESLERYWLKLYREEKKKQEIDEYNRKHGVADLLYQNELEKELHSYRRDFIRCKELKNEKVEQDCFWQLSRELDARGAGLKGSYWNLIHGAEIQKAKDLQEEVKSDQQSIALQNKKYSELSNYNNIDKGKAISFINKDYEVCKSLESYELESNCTLNVWHGCIGVKESSSVIRDLCDDIWKKRKRAN